MIEQDSALWWARIKADREALMGWLRKQYYGEARAAMRLEAFVERYGHQAKMPRQRELVARIIEQERAHAAWVGALLRARGESPSPLTPRHERYWAQTLDQIKDWETGCAVAAHAEGMRLARIRAIVADEGAPQDIREVFARILPEEEFHERAFSALTSAEARAQTREHHVLGAQALGLEV